MSINFVSIETKIYPASPANENFLSWVAPLAPQYRLLPASQINHIDAGSDLN